MTAARRWCLVALGVVLLVSTPLVLRNLPATGSDVSARGLLAKIGASRSVPYSGTVVSTGTLQLSVNSRFSSLADLLGSTNRMRVWWRTPDRWRVDNLRPTGETDLFRDPDGTTSWEYESERAKRSSNVTVRLPNASDLLPPSLARRVLADAHRDEISRIGSERIAGRSAPGLRLTPSAPQSSVDHVDVWADEDTGIPVRVAVVADGETHPSLQTTFSSLTTKTPDLDDVLFFPPPSVRLRQDDIIDIASAADRFSRAVPPSRLAGLPSRHDVPTRSVGLYGRGVTALIALPLWGSAARPLREQLGNSIGMTKDSAGVHLSSGPLSLLLTRPDRFGSSWLLVGTVNDATLSTAAGELAFEREPR